jgi:hypothetical protein
MSYGNSKLQTPKWFKTLGWELLEFGILELHAEVV